VPSMMMSALFRLRAGRASGWFSIWTARAGYSSSTPSARGMPSRGQRSATGVGLGVGDNVGDGEGEALGVGEEVGVGDALGDGVGEGVGGDAVAMAMMPPMTMAATATAPPISARRDRSSAEKRDELGDGDMRRILVCEGSVTMGRMA
jgi:hypothetical protein